MTDLLSTLFLQSHTGTNLFPDLGFKQLGLIQTVADANRESSPGNAEQTPDQANGQINTSQGFGGETNSDHRDGQRDQAQVRFTVMIRKRSGELRTISVRAVSAVEAQSAARSVVDAEEEGISVDQSTVIGHPDPERGRVA